MSQVKDATTRYKVLDKCFSDFRHRYFIDDLIEECAEALKDKDIINVSRRTVLNDIAFMESPEGWKIPLERLKDGKRVYYRYRYRDYSIYNNELSEEEVSQLKTVIETLSSYRGLPSTEWLEEIISNLEYRFDLKAHSENVISFEQNKDLKGIEYLSTLIDAATNKQTISLQYKNFYGKEVEWTIYPYYLKQYNNRWFLFGWNKDINSLSNIALDRIEDVTLTDLPFRENKEIDFETYFDDIVGVTKPDPEVLMQTIRLKFDLKRFPYVVSKPIHSSQEVVDEDKGIIEISVRPNKELEALLFSFGPQVEILSPESYRQQFAEKLQDNLKKYFPVQKGCTE